MKGINIMYKRNFIINIISSILISIIFIVLSIKITLSYKTLYYNDIYNLFIYKDVDLTIDQIKNIYDYLIYYLNSRKNIDFILPYLPSSKEGVIHFKEVKSIILNIYNIFNVSLIISLPLIYTNLKNKNLEFLKYSSILLLSFPLLLIPFSLNFHKSFDIFHRMFFANDYWLFDPIKDPIITLLPEQFFFHCAFLITSLITLSGMINIYLYIKLKSKL
ncbi:TIGR01906 family membrane protein [Clostridium niameyense]|uniref:TIGR01906 family membrane protein n=1 Tax=Clostridium niameyense TaxID=1622073 RepID=UPI00067EE6FC